MNSEESKLLLDFQKLSLGGPHLTEDVNHPVLPRKFGPDGRLYLISKNQDGTEKLTDCKTVFLALKERFADRPELHEVIVELLSKFPY